ncbi:hypothetical protein V6582_05705 [Agrobacterium vitis]|uniref:hypothetical protein n=1 Tax=Agrobacterium vitis TaxID=373 RepID=UPI0012E77A08|nr:hypothetical protein [Agrobacterium vitis]MVA24513.1 hypothetical protein [Agrobacterium vitis]
MTVSSKPSELLLSLNTRLEPFVKTGIPMRGEAVASIIEFLRQVSEMSREIEMLAEKASRKPSLENVLLAALDDKVLLFRPRRKSRLPSSPDGGDAA